MKRISFDIAFKIITLMLLTINLIISYTIYDTINYDQPEPTEVGRYKEIKVKKYGFGGEREEVLILDTKTGITIPN